jgi:PAS domain-containing protein
LVLTNVEREILWEDKGFEKMTGYTAQEAADKKTDFSAREKHPREYSFAFQREIGFANPF